MKKIIVLALSILVFASCRQKHQQTGQTGTMKTAEITVIDKGNVNFRDYFLDKTMRLDYFHSGTVKEEHFAVDRVVTDGVWPGSQKNLLDKLGLGLYFFKVIDKESRVLLYSRGFASIFGEWQTTPEADSVWGTFHESMRFPWPLKPVTILLEKRDSTNTFRQIWATDIDPANRQVNPAELRHTEKVDVILENGPASEKLDIVILGDGYSKTEMDKFRKDAKRLSDVLLSAEPFRTRSKDMNIRAVETPAEESGVCKPHPGVFKRTPLSAQYGAFDSERYVLSYDNKTIRNVASAVPYDFMVIVVNERTYGGGGIYNLYTTVSADNKYADYIMVHELGHHMAALADEYYTSAVAYEVQPVKVEPWETNITALFDKSNVKWKALLEPVTPLPTPWNKDEFDKFGYKIQKERDSLRKARVPEEIMEALFLRQYQQENAFFSQKKYKDKVGAFEGAGYQQKGLYRSQLDCIMFTRHMKYCKVCENTLNTVIGEYSK
ncbi:MAG: M64 family metallo-endopeptidase [Bacteroidetes bacterium]|nr:M64 family metallo-endopeptidase [Bacteroidota bacterium]